MQVRARLGALEAERSAGDSGGATPRGDITVAGLLECCVGGPPALVRLKAHQTVYSRHFGWLRHRKERCFLKEDAISVLDSMMIVGSIPH